MKRFAGVRRRHHEVPGVKIRPSVLSQIAVSKTEPGTRTTRTSPAWSARSTSGNWRRIPRTTRTPIPTPAACASQPGHPRVRRDVQGADQGAASVADRHSGTELQGAPRVSAPSPSTAWCSPTPTRPEWLAFKNNRNNEGVPRPHLYRQGPLLPARLGRESTSTRNCWSTPRSPKPLCARTPAMMAQFSVPCRASRSWRTPSTARCGSTTAKTSKTPTPRPRATRNTGTMPGDEGMTGLSTRFAFKILQGIQLRPPEVAANPVHLDVRPRAADRAGTVPPEDRGALSAFLKEYLSRATPSSSARKSRPPTSKAIPSTARTSSTATSPTPTSGSRIRSSDPNTGENPRPGSIERRTGEDRKPAGISNPKDFRNEVVNFVLRARAKHDGKNPSWTSYEKAPGGHREEDVLQHRGTPAGHLLQHQGQRRRTEEAPGLRQSHDFKGYTEKQVRLLCEWYLRVRKSSGSPCERPGRADPPQLGGPLK